MDQKYLTTNQVKEILKISTTTLWRYRVKGIIPYIKYGHKILYVQEHIDAFVDSNIINKSKSKNHEIQ